jgi:uncharacterized membrane protein
MRGIVMVIMASDHASDAFNAGRLVTDSIFLYGPGQKLGILQFTNRWVSHLCAPTFLFLAGTSLALSIDHKRRRGLLSAAIDRDLLIRGLIILSVDLFLINWFWLPGTFLLHVMYAIGLAIILMIPLRRLPTHWVVAAALIILTSAELFLGDEFIVRFSLPATARTFFMRAGVIDTPIESMDFFSRIGFADTITVAYPLLPWAAMMMLGWSFGRYLLLDPDRSTRRSSPAKPLLVCGGIALVVFTVLRGMNTYGNMRLLRLDNSLIQWLHVSKYPPSLTFTTLELGLMALILSTLFRWQHVLDSEIRNCNPILVFGQTAFFFYIGHILVLEVASRALGMHHKCGLLESSLATILALALMYPLCLWYRQYKAAHAETCVRFF